MNLQEQLYRIKEMMGLHESGIDIGSDMGEKIKFTIKNVYTWVEDEFSRLGTRLIDKDDGLFDNKKNAKKFIEQIYNHLVYYYNMDYIPVFRAVVADDVDLSPYGIGESWSFDLESAKQFGRHLLGKVKIISGMVPSQNVDWEQAVRRYCIFSFDDNDSEFELPIPSGRLIKNVKVI